MPRFNFQLLSSNSIRSVLFMLLTLLMFNTFGQQKTDHPWYKDRLLRIYHANMKNWVVTGFNVARFVENCVTVNAEAIVVIAGGICSFYPSKIEQPVRTEAVEFSPDGNYLLTGGHDQYTRFYRTSDYSLAYEYEAAPCEYIHFSRDGRLLLLSFEDSGVLSLLVFKSSYADRSLYMELQKKPLNLLKLLNL